RAEPPGISETVARAVRQRVDFGYSAGLVVGVVNREGRAYLGYGGENHQAVGTPDERTLFEIGSVTKVFTSVLLAEMVARGEVTFDEPVQSLLTGRVVVPRGSAEISLEHLATQRSGLPLNPANLCADDATRPFECYTLERFYSFLNGFNLPREPGLAWEYSNTGFGLLGHALVVRSGKPYESLLRERVLEPLGMTSTFVDVPADDLDRVATGYSGVIARPSFRMPVLEGAGALHSTVEDLLTFVSCHLGIRESPLTSVLRETQVRRSDTSYAGVGIGLGWWLWALPGGEVVQHGGDTPGFTSFVGFHPVRGVGVVVLSNARGGTYSSVLDVGLHLLDSRYPLTSIRRPATVDAEALMEETGIYEEPGGDAFEVGFVRDHLVIYHVRSRFEMTLHPESSRRFAALDLELPPQTTAGFVLDGEGRVTAMDWTQGGRTTRYARKAAPARIVMTEDGGRRELALSGGSGAAYDVEATDDWANWTPVGVLRLPSDRLPDGNGDGFRARFYRAVRRR
ncbi:MAG: beta-lactamase family protein, partial [Verrucomicrobiales bacterium]|nr:beta-lactamase family protein [Verrucomicrobiales bacterium]